MQVIKQTNAFWLLVNMEIKKIIKQLHTFCLPENIQLQ